MKNAVCKGAWALGSACGICSRCIATKPADEADWPDVSPEGLRKMAEIAAPNNGRVFLAAADRIERLGLAAGGLSSAEPLDLNATSRAFVRAHVESERAQWTGGVTSEILTEVRRATEKFPTWPTDPLHALAVLGEEFGELTKAMLQFTYEPHKTTRAEIRAEAMQTAAMALRLAMSLDQYEYRECKQHSQGGAA